MEGNKNTYQVLKTPRLNRPQLYYEENKAVVAKTSSKPVIAVIIILS